MLYLTSFKLQQIFSVAKFSKYLTTSSLSLSMLWKNSSSEKAAAMEGTAFWKSSPSKRLALQKK